MRSNLVLLKVLRSALYSSLFLSAALSSSDAVFADELSGANANRTTDTPAFSYSAPSETQVVGSPGTGKLQLQVLIQINQALSRGAITAAEASNLKEQLNGWNDKESWYTSLHEPIPASLVQENTRLLTAMSADLTKEHPLKQAPSSADAIHTKIDELISGALARNKITSSQAERYYSRLAEIESNIESSKADPASTPDADAANNQSLSKLEQDVRKAAQN